MIPVQLQWEARPVEPGPQLARWHVDGTLSCGASLKILRRLLAMLRFRRNVTRRSCCSVCNE